MDQNSTDMMIKLKKEIVINRIFSIITMVVSIVVLVVVLVTCIRINNFMDMAEPVITELEKLDMETLNEALENINSVMNFMDWNTWAEKLDSLNLTGISEVFEGIDVEELKETLQNINDGADRLQAVKEWFENSPLNIWKSESVLYEAKSSIYKLNN